jgi:hypothetical protein
MDDDGRAAAEAVIEALGEPRRSHMPHLREVILDALPDIDVGVWDYSGTGAVARSASTARSRPDRRDSARRWGKRRGDTRAEPLDGPVGAGPHGVGPRGMRGRCRASFLGWPRADLQGRSS